MKLKTSKAYAIEGAIQLEGSTDFNLIGSEYVARIEKDYEFAVKNGTISSEQNSFFSVYGLDCKFFYIAQQFKNNKVFKYEVGIGYLQQVDDKFVLKRSQPLYFSEYDGVANPVIGAPRPFLCQHDEYLVVTTYIPRSYLELLTDDNCIITSVAPHVPSITYISEDSLVGRFGENIQAVPVNNIKDIPSFSQAIVDSLTQYTKQLTFKSSKITSKSISTDYLSFKPTNSKPPAKDGTLYFNKDNNTFSYYADNEWRLLTWQKDPNETAT